MFLFLIIVWLISIAIWCVMHISDCFYKIFGDYGYISGSYPFWNSKTKQLCAMAFAGGWMFWPYFIYLVYKYFKISSNNKGV